MFCVTSHHFCATFLYSALESGNHNHLVPLRTPREILQLEVTIIVFVMLNSDVWGKVNQSFEKKVNCLKKVNFEKRIQVVALDDWCAWLDL